MFNTQRPPDSYRDSMFNEQEPFILFHLSPYLGIAVAEI